MREVKFRAWDKVNEMWLKITGFETHVLDDGKTASINKGLGGMFHDGDYIGTFQKHAGEQNNVTLIQYTGLKDVNGREVYEGYVVENERGYRFEVINQFGCFGINVERKVSFSSDETMEIFIPLYHVIEDLKIIGNIFENPELLEVNK